MNVRTVVRGFSFQLKHNFTIQTKKNSSALFFFSISETCENNSLLDREIILKPTRNDTSVMYETVFDSESENGNIESNGAGGEVMMTPTTKKTTRKPKSECERKFIKL